MSIRILLVAIVSVLSGCARLGCALLRGLHESACQYGVLPQSQPERCMTYAEYKTARVKLRNPKDEVSPKGDKQVDPRYKEWIP